MSLSPRGSLVAGTLAAIGASVCCVGPLVLLMLGISGAWIGRVTAVEPYRPIFTGLTLIFLALAFRGLYFVRRACAVGDDCGDDRVLKRQRLVFWLVAVPVALLLAFPLYAPLLF
jgi:mercuric ion transport protein